jgi:hypothetical protein
LHTIPEILLHTFEVCSKMNYQFSRKIAGPNLERHRIIEERGIWKEYVGR